MLRSLALIVSLVALVPSVHAQDARAIAAALKQGGHVMVFRHGATNRDMADTDPLNVDDPNNVTKQRQLSERGRQVAHDINGAFKTLQIPIGAVYTSKFYRAVETGRLISGKEVTATADISEGDAQARSDTARDGYQHAGRQPQAEHRRCFRQGLVRRARGRSVGLQA
jgi:broad specificity phosphatase PhoE